jgi:hypothetical protein
MRSLRFALLLAALTALPARCEEMVAGAPRELTECVDASSCGRSTSASTSARA